jgi:hypothetical protein
MLCGHGSDYNNRHQATHKHHEQAQILQVWYSAISEDDNGNAQPQNQEVGDVDVPGLDNQIRVVDRVQGHGDVGRDLDDGGEVEDPAKEADPACKEPNRPAPLWAWGEGRPVIDAASRGDRRGELQRRPAGLADHYLEEQA